MGSFGAEFSAINALRTGNIIIDLGVAMTVPAVLRTVFDAETLKRLKDYFLPKRQLLLHRAATRTISCVTKGWGQDQHNHLLQKAIKLYLTQHLQVVPPNAQVQLTAMDTPSHSRGRGRDEDPMQNQRLTWIAEEKEWVNVGESISFRQFKQLEQTAAQKQQAGDKPDQFLIFELSCGEQDGAERIDAFIRAALDWYKRELARLKDHRRWLYSMVSNDALKRRRPNDELPDFRYKRHALSDHKTFSSLFFPQKDSLLRLLADFERGTGKYAVAGFPQKVGLLLHGPPGTGKTSLIKALAHHTGRSIINVSLAQVQTNTQLADIMYDLTLDVIGGEPSRRRTFSDLIFVIEDIDACSSIVHRRDGADRHELEGPYAEEGSWSPSEASSSASTAPTVSPSHRSATPSPLPRPPAAWELTAKYGPPPVPPPPGSGLPPLNMSLAPPPPLPPTMPPAGYHWPPVPPPTPDILNLAGLLDVLDGCVDTPGRMLIMTSNHPEALDPALIRPGRIDRCLLLGYLQLEEAAQMLAHYFSASVSDEQRARLDRSLRCRMTPATMEQLCAEHESIDSLLDELEQCAAGGREGYEGERAAKRLRRDGWAA
uniref:AAA+ ATPase domain-containing protein n=1 Tax=Emiliania huxleyi TaxID=2903 RepID=A0A7S3TDJ9_EMIHU|mmetsp:Transcript_19022/g.56364  ORF Transcript_19022/g.56364 Transcript_19022/m.56364 type:complete len:599 (+) Transcript_19022:91-1887(+)